MVLKELNVGVTPGVADNPERIDRTQRTPVFDGQAAEDRWVLLPLIFAPPETENNV